MSTEIFTPEYCFFWHGPFSQWHIDTFRAPLWRGGPELEFNCAEQYMMASKAILFGDVNGSLDDGGNYVSSALERIMAAKTPREQKAIGRDVRGFNQAIWDQHDMAIVFRGSFAKYTQNPILQNELHLTGERSLVEGSPSDEIWGVGLAYNDPAILNPSNWRGPNKLGKVLTVVRDIINSIERSSFVVDVWADNPFI